MEELLGAATGADGVSVGGLLDFFDPTGIPFAAVLLIGTFGVLRLVRRSVDAFAERRSAQRLTIKQTMTLVEFASYAAATILAGAQILELSSQAFFALSGTLAVAAGFLLKGAGESVVAGLSILISRPFQVGDRITFGGHYGEVREIGLRTVRLVTLDDNLVTIPSVKILTEPVASANAGELACMVVMPFYVSAASDHRRAREIVHDALLSSRFLDLSRTRVVHVGMTLHDRLGVVIELVAKGYVFDARHEKDFTSDVTDRVLRAFRDRGIALPGEPELAVSLPTAPLAATPAISA